MSTALNQSKTARRTHIDFVDHPEIRDPRTRAKLLRSAEKLLDEGPTFRHDDELTLFKAMHACRRLLGRNQGGSARSERLRELHERIVSHLVNQNIGLLYDMRRRTRVVGVDMDDLVSEGFWAIFQAVTKFDPWRGYRFSTYACTSVLRGFLLLAKRRRRVAEQMSFLREAALADAGEAPEPELDHELLVERLRRTLSRNDAGLTPAERFVIERRLLHPPAARPETLEEIGQLFRLSKERVRQIQVSGLDKLRNQLRLENDGDGSSEIGSARAGGAFHPEGTMVDVNPQGSDSVGGDDSESTPDRAGNRRFRGVGRKARLVSSELN